VGEWGRELIDSLGVERPVDNRDLWRFRLTKMQSKDDAEATRARSRRAGKADGSGIEMTATKRRPTARRSTQPWWLQRGASQPDRRAEELVVARVLAGYRLRVAFEERLAR
jgi:hypothetical protein